LRGLAPGLDEFQGLYRLVVKERQACGEILLSMRESSVSFNGVKRLRSDWRLSLVFGTLVCAFALQSFAQEARPALIPVSQGSGSSSNGSLSGIGELTDQPIEPGQVVHVSVFNAPDFSTVSRVSGSGDVAIPMLGATHLAGLNSQKASELIASQLKGNNLILEPKVVVTVEALFSGITVLGEVRSPGIYPPPARRQLSDVLAAAGGMTANSGRVIEISNDHAPDEKVEVAWDPTMHNTANFDRPVRPGDRILVRGCGIAYVGGHVGKPGAYSLCGSQQVTISEVIDLAGGVTPLTSEKHSYLIRTGADGKRIVREIDLRKILNAKAEDPLVKEDDIVYVTPSSVKDVLNRSLTFALTASTSLLYAYHP
jgi:polysaccharide export outer membrane protein